MTPEEAAAAAAKDDELKTTDADTPAADQQQPPAADSQEPDEAAKLWAEFSDDGAEQKPEKINGETVSDDFTKSQDEPNKDDAAEGAGKEQAADAAKVAKQPDSPPPAEDIWANASPELRAAHEAEIAALKKATNDAKAHAGRMRKQYEEIKASAQRGADKPSSKTVGDTLDEGLAEYPEIRDPVKTALAPIEQQLARLDQFEASQRDARQIEVNRHIVSQQELLEERHPGWEKEYVQGPLAKQFYDWIKSPDRPVKFVKTVFETNAEHIFDAAAAIEVFDAFKAELAAQNPTPAPQDGGQTQELSAKRAAQLDGSRSPKTPGGPPRVTGIPREGDPQAIWSAFGDDNADDRLTRRRV
jgi:hypothetical protein